MNTSDNLYQTPLTVATDVSLPWIDTKNQSQISFNFRLVADGSEAVTGKLYVEATDDPAQASTMVYQVVPPAGSLHIASTITTVAISGSFIQLTAMVSGAFAIVLANQARYIRLRLDYTSGATSASLFTVMYSARGLNV